MKFVVKDLMISVLPLRGRGGLPGGGCDAGCTNHCGSGCTNPCASGGACGTGTTKDLDWIAHVFDPVVLVELKQQLKDALALVEVREKAALEAMKPQSRSEVELLRARLTEALQELDQPQPFESAGKQDETSGES